MDLTPNIAARLVKKLEPIQPYDVIIINKDGFIVGASNQTLIGQRHESARIRLNEFRQQPHSATRVREQGNGRCLFVYNQLVGAVGLSGKESQVFPYLEMVRTIAVMFLEREFEIQNEVIQNASRAQVLMRLISRHTDTDKVKQVMAAHEIDYSIPRTLLSLKFEPISDNEAAADNTQLFRNAVNNITSLVESRFSFYGDMILPDEGNAAILVFCADRSQNLSQHEKRLEQLCNLIIEDARSNYRISTKIMIGKRCCTLADYDGQYAQLTENFKVAVRMFPTHDLFHSNSLVLGNLAAGMPDSIKKNVVNHVLHSILTSSQKNQYLETIGTYFDTNMNIGETAHLLDIHRNTLQYRFKKIEELTGYCMYKLDDILTLRLAYLLYRLQDI